MDRNNEGNPMLFRDRQSDSSDPPEGVGMNHLKPPIAPQRRNEIK
jgi:hypothetical protein